MGVYIYTYIYIYVIMHAIGMYVYTTNNIWILGVLEHAEILGYPIFRQAKWFNGQWKSGRTKTTRLDPLKLYVFIIIHRCSLIQICVQILVFQQSAQQKLMLV